MKAKAISLWQPWATAIVVGAKRFETRGWSPAHRGLLAIHAAQTSMACQAIIRRGGREADVWRAILRVRPGESLEQALRRLPRGRILGTANLVEVVDAQKVAAAENAGAHDLVYENEHGETWLETEVGDFSPRRFAWRLEDVRAFMNPFEWKGMQGLFDVELPAKPAGAASA